jgi:hypothetical protein
MIMMIANHGGGCCGISHIFNMSEGPAYSVAEVLPLEEAWKNHAKAYRGGTYDGPSYSSFILNEEGSRAAYESYLKSHGVPFSEKDNDDTLQDRVKLHATNALTGQGRFIWVTRPKETYGDRLKGFIEHIQEVRNSGMIEVTLISYQLSWRKFLEDLGFKEVNSFINSNSNNKVTVFHFNYGPKNGEGK